VKPILPSLKNKEKKKKKMQKPGVVGGWATMYFQKTTKGAKKRERSDAGKGKGGSGSGGATRGRRNRKSIARDL